MLKKSLYLIGCFIVLNSSSRLLAQINSTLPVITGDMAKKYPSPSGTKINKLNLVAQNNYKSLVCLG